MRTELQITYDDYKTLPEQGPRYQVIEGELIMTPAPNLRHHRIVWALGNALYNHVEAQALGLVVGSPVDMILTATNVFQPDLVYLSHARKSLMAEEGIRGAPDLCVEVLSPSTAAQDRDVKRKLYARFGVVELWLVDPETRTVELFRLQENPGEAAARFAETETLRSALLPGFEAPLAKLFAP